MSFAEEELADLKTELAGYIQTLEDRAGVLPSSIDTGFIHRRGMYLHVVDELKRILHASERSTKVQTD
jgi:hypothetical protein